MIVSKACDLLFIGRGEELETRVFEPCIVYVCLIAETVLAGLVSCFGVCKSNG